MHSLPGFIIFFHEVSFFLPTNIGISSEPPHFACLFSFIAYYPHPKSCIYKLNSRNGKIQQLET